MIKFGRSEDVSLSVLALKKAMIFRQIKYSKIFIDFTLKITLFSKELSNFYKLFKNFSVINLESNS